jgi:hypothetical protein
MTEYVKKRTPVEAWQVGTSDRPDWIAEAIQSGVLWSQNGRDGDPKQFDAASGNAFLDNGLGSRPVEDGDWIIRKQDGLLNIMADQDFTNLFEEK